MSTDPRIEAAAAALGERIDMHLPSAFDDGCLAHDGSHCEDDGDCIRDMATAAVAAIDKAPTITTFTDLDSLPDGSVIIDKHGDVSQRRGDVWCSYETAPMPSRQIAKYLPARVIHRGTE